VQTLLADAADKVAVPMSRLARGTQ
jgi:hypothetical protein